MENAANDSNQNYVDSNNLKSTLSEKLEIATKEESDVVNVDFQHSDSMEESEVFTFPTQFNGHVDRNHSTSPSKQRVIDTINEVISDHLPVETQDESVQGKVLDNNLTAVGDDGDPVSVPTNAGDELTEVELEQNLRKSPSESCDDEPEKTFVKPVENYLNDENVIVDKQTNLKEIKQTTLPTASERELADISRVDYANEALSPKPSGSTEADKVDLEPKHDNNFQLPENNILVSQVHPENIQNSIKDLSESASLETEELRDESISEELVTSKTVETPVVPTIEITEDSKKLVDEGVVENNEEPVAEAIPELEKCSSDSTDVSQVVEKKDEEPAPEWLDMLGNGLLKKKVLKAGLGRESRPVQGDIVNIRCEGTLEDGTVVDKNSHLQMVLGDLDVVQGIDMCVALMEDKETSQLFTDARYAYSIYGRADYKPPIPKNASITYEIEILSITRGKTVMEMTTAESILHSDKKRSRGNDLYSRGDYAGAIDTYKRGLKYLEGRKEKEVVDMKVKCLNNLSAAQLKVKAFAMALQSLEAVLDEQPQNVKALFRKGKCLEGLGKEDAALECMKKASLLDPENKLIVQDLGRLRSRVAVTHKKEKEIYQRMFQQRKQKEEGNNEEVEEEEEEQSLLPLIGSAMVAAVAVIGGLLWYRYR